MPESTLEAHSALNELSITRGDTRIWECPPMSIVSISTPLGGKQYLNDQLNLAFGICLPATGKVSRKGDTLALLGLQSDQCFLIGNEQWPDPVAHVALLLDNCAYLTDQSDSWAALSIKGPLSRSALERVCPIDIAVGVFDISCVARTAMEHLSVIIEQPEPDTFRLYSPRSSSQNFAEIICTSLDHVAIS